jgi:hypothetical protein
MWENYTNIAWETSNVYYFEHLHYKHGYSQLKTVRATKIMTEVNDLVIQGKMDELKTYLTMIPNPKSRLLVLLLGLTPRCKNLIHVRSRAWVIDYVSPTGCAEPVQICV